MTDERTLLRRLDEALLDGPGGEAEAALVYAAGEIERLSPHDPVPSCLRALADVLAQERRERDHVISPEGKRALERETASILAREDMAEDVIDPLGEWGDRT